MTESKPVVTVVITETTVRTYRLDADDLDDLNLPASGDGIDDLDDEQLAVRLIDEFDSHGFEVTDREVDITRTEPSAA